MYHFFLKKFKKLIKGKYFSNFQSIFRGVGLEIDDFRKYLPGDQFKQINWKISAKYQDFYVYLLSNDRNLNMDIFLDINYNRKGGFDQKNYENVIQLMKEIINYSAKNQIYLKIYYSDTKNINSLVIGKNFPLAYKFLQKIVKLSKDCSKNYISHVSKFLTISKLDKKKRIIVIFSDFLDLSEVNFNDIKLLDINNNLYLFQIFCDLNFGKNNDSFYLSRDENLKNLKLIRF